jgi:hypothetical protein
MRLQCIPVEDDRRIEVSPAIMAGIPSKLLEGYSRSGRRRSYLRCSETRHPLTQSTGGFLGVIGKRRDIPAGTAVILAQAGIQQKQGARSPMDFRLRENAKEGWACM